MSTSTFIFLPAVRMIASDITMESCQAEAKALAFKFTQVDIMSNSWGFADDGKTMEPVGDLARTSIKLGIYVVGKN